MSGSNFLRLTSFFVPAKCTNGQLGVLSILPILLMPKRFYVVVMLCAEVTDVKPVHLAANQTQPLLIQADFLAAGLCAAR